MGRKDAMHPHPLLLKDLRTGLPTVQGRPYVQYQIRGGGAAYQPPPLLPPVSAPQECRIYIMSVNLISYLERKKYKGKYTSV